MILSLCLLLPALGPSSQEICSAPGALPAPTLYLSQTSVKPGESVQLQCSVISQLLATRIVFCQDGEEVSSQRGLLGKLTYNSDHAISGGSSGNYSCGYEIKDNDNQVIRSQLSPPQHLIISGALPAPTLYLSQTSARPGDSVRLQCSVFSWALATRIVFFKDGEEVSSQRSLLGKLTYDYDHVVSRGSSGNYSCGYEIKGSKNQVTRSQLSPAQHLSVTGLDLKLLLGITIPAVLVLAVVLYLLGKKGNVSTPLIALSNCLSAMSLPRNQRSVHEVAVAFSRLLGRARQQGRPERVQRDTSNPYEEDIHYASVDWLGSSRQPLPQREETLTYANINLQRGRCH